MEKTFKMLLVTALAIAGGFFTSPPAHAGKYSDKAASYFNGDDSPLKTNNRYSRKNRVQKSSNIEEERTETIEKKSRKHSTKQRKSRNHKKSRNSSSNNVND